MAIIKKDATISNTDDAFPGSFEVILSAQTKDRDGDVLLKDGWKLPLPDHITFDQDHEMSVKGTVGSGVPSIDPETGNLVVKGTYSSLQRAQDVRTLVNEGHIKTTSVAFMSEKTQKDGVTVTQRELLNGAFVAIPSNREALVLSSKGFKAGARNSKADAEKVQGIHDHAAALGAECVGAPAKSFVRKDADTEDASDPAALVPAIDAAIDEAINLFASVDVESLPAEVQQAIALVQAADATVDELLDAIGIPDPDEDAAASGADQAPATGAQAPVAGVRSAPVADADSDAVTVKELEEIALRIQAAQFI